MKTATWAALRARARQHGFADMGVSVLSLPAAWQARRETWLAKGYAGTMQWLAKHSAARQHAPQLWPGTATVLSLRMNYLPQLQSIASSQAQLKQPTQGVIALYAQRRDYHKILRKRLMRLAADLDALLAAAAESSPALDAPTAPSSSAARAFADSAPVAEVEHAVQSALAWRGKHTLALCRDAGSFFFLGELYLPFDLRRLVPEVPLASPQPSHCGSCRACLDVCPTQAIVAPGQLDARRCISYLTIEHKGSIPLALRPALGNRIFGCDDCQIFCPWNKYAEKATVPELATLPHLAQGTLLHYWAWDEADFLAHTEGTALRRMGWVRWQRNLAVALGNALRAAGAVQQKGIPTHSTTQRDIVHALHARLAALAASSALAAHDKALLQEHITWALEQA